eukprot:3086899-Rhodomonas_salina.1
MVDPLLYPTLIHMTLHLMRAWGSGYLRANWYHPARLAIFHRYLPRLRDIHGRGDPISSRVAPAPRGLPVQTSWDSQPLPVLGMAFAVSTEVSASAPLAEDPRSRCTFPDGSSPVRENCWYQSAISRPNHLTGSSARSGTADAAAREEALPPPPSLDRSEFPPVREVPITTSAHPIRVCCLCQSAHFAASPSQGRVSAAQVVSSRSSPSPSPFHIACAMQCVCGCVPLRASVRSFCKCFMLSCLLGGWVWTERKYA